MARLIKTLNAKDATGKTIQHALWDTNYSYQTHCWEEATDRNRIVDEIEYDGLADRQATRTMAMGTLRSLHQQTLNEIHGDRYTDKRGTTWTWDTDMGRYVTIPNHDC